MGMAVPMPPPSASGSNNFFNLPATDLGPQRTQYASTDPSQAGTHFPAPGGHQLSACVIACRHAHMRFIPALSNDFMFIQQTLLSGFSLWLDSLSVPGISVICYASFLLC